MGCVYFCVVGRCGMIRRDEKRTGRIDEAFRISMVFVMCFDIFKCGFKFYFDSFVLEKFSSINVILCIILLL